MNPPPRTGAGASAWEVYECDMVHWLQEFTRNRLAYKSRAFWSTIAIAFLTGLSGVIGAVSAASGLAWFGIFNAGIGAIVATVFAWDGLFRHRDLWRARTVSLNELQSLDRESRMAVALGASETAVAESALPRLHAILATDVEQWTSFRSDIAAARDAGPAKPSR